MGKIIKKIMKKYIDNKFVSVFEENGILNMVWKEETKNLTDEEFKNQASVYIKVFKETKIKNIIVDMRKFYFELNLEIIDWRNKNIISEYNKIGVKKFAFINEKQTVNQNNSENTFITKYFQTKEESENWIKS